MPVADPQTYLANITGILKKKWPDHRRIHIVCHGHSVPGGYFATPDVRTFDSYPHLLHVALSQRFPFSVINVIVTSIGREESETGGKRFDGEVLVHRPDVLTIDYGLNDRRIGLERAKVAWKSMIERAQARGIKVLCLTPSTDVTQRPGVPPDQSEPLKQQAAQIRGLAAEYGVGLVDSLAAFEAYQQGGGELWNLLSVSNHPNRAGHDMIVRELMKWFPDPDFQMGAALQRIMAYAAGRRIGAPAGDPALVGGVVMQKFTGGPDTEGECAVTDSARGTWLVRNDFYRNWKLTDHGGPTEDEHGEDNGAGQLFDRVRMTWRPGVGTKIFPR
jgi:lysophospholipase L1-like esterase